MPGGREPIGRVRACTECRQQKLRCDVYRDTSKPCSRCERMGLKCVVSNTFERKGRQTKAELRKELLALKRQAGLLKDGETSQDDSETDPVHHRRGSTRRWTADQIQQSVPDISSTNGNVIVQNDSSNLMLPVSSSLSGWNLTGQSLAGNVEQNIATDSGLVVDDLNKNVTAAPNLLNPGASSVVLTDVLSQSSNSPSTSISSFNLGEIGVDKRRVLDCFALFWKNYANLLPGLFNSEPVAPEEIYRQSEFLFWTIVCTGARKYNRDPTIFDRLSKRIVSLATTAMCLNQKPIPIIQGILILCSWPIPTVTVFKDSSLFLAGAATQLALQNGLHIISREADFASKPEGPTISVGSQAFHNALQQCLKGKTTAKEEILFRMRLWANCLIVLQGTNIRDGLPPTIIPSLTNISRNQMVQSYLSPDLEIRLKLHQIQVEALTTIRRDVDLETPQDSSTLSSLIKVFDSMVVQLNMPNANDLQLFERNCARVLILCFHFFLMQPDSAGLIELYTASCELIQILTRMSELHSYLTQYYMRMLTLASYCILRICKSHLNEFIQMEQAEDNLFLAVDIFRRRSVQANDLDSLTAIMLTKLWSSNTVFMRIDGTRNSLQLGLRGRMAMSVVFDCFYWWRLEFGTLSNTKNPNDESEMPNEIFRPANSMDVFPPLGSNSPMSTFIAASLNFPGFNNWDWSAYGNF